MTLFTRSTLMALSLITSPFTYAANWQMIGGEYTPTIKTSVGTNGTITTYGQPTQLYAGAPFTDGALTSTRYISGGNYSKLGGDWVLRNSSDPATSTELFYFGAYGADGTWDKTVQVNLTPGAEGIKVGGFAMYYSNPATNDGSSIFGGWIYDVAIGNTLTPVVDYYGPGPSGGIKYQGSYFEDWVPLTVNGDGTYTATWNFLGFGDQMPQYSPDTLPRMSVTFQAAVPEPGQTVLFVLGLLGVAARVRSRRIEERPAMRRGDSI